jgi:CubicO group peptidase (beta-lactamase class C family)
VTAVPRLSGESGLSSVTVRHLLSMTRGAGTDGPFDLDEVAVSGASWATRFAAAPQLEPPGTRFRYDNGASQLLAEVVHHAVGDLAAFAEARLFTPLGIRRWSWLRDPAGVPCGAGHLSMSAPSLARIGRLLCGEGRGRGGHRIIEGRWVRAMRTPTSPGGPPEDRPYGMGLWLESPGVFFGAGWAGQLLWCRPPDDVVVTLSDPGFDYGPPARDAMPVGWRAPLEVLRSATA